MKQLTLKMLSLGLFFALSTAFAHEGHDHGAPTFQAPKGGVLKSASFGHFELVKKGSEAQIYWYDESGKQIETQDLQLTAELELPRKKPTPLTLANNKTHWSAQIDAKGAHRFTLKVNMQKGCEKDYVTFTIEK